MVYSGTILGRYVSLRAVDKEDALFILKIRLDEKKKKFIHDTPNDQNLQEKWIEAQRRRENDYYFLILDKEGKPLGTISLYEISGASGELGRWVSYGNAYENLESAMLLHDFAYEKIGLKEVHTTTMIQNEKVKKFWTRFGFDHSEIVEFDDWTGCRKTVLKETYYGAIRSRLAALLYRA